MVNTGHIWYGETLAELAEATGESAAVQTPAFTEEQLLETIELYNSYAADMATAPPTGWDLWSISATTA